MREILFRGKTKAIAGSPYNNGKPDGEWVKGYLYNDVGCWKIRQFETDYADYVPYEVEPETVGQYTGLTDKNGKKIFEGDIVKGKDALEKDLEVYGYIDHRNGSFVIVGDFMTHYRWLDYDIEIIGNIHDNPELVKGGAE